MGKRITLTDLEIKIIVEGLEGLRDEANLNYAVIRTGKAVYQSIIDKLTPKAQP